MFCGHKCEDVARKQVEEILASHKGRMAGRDPEPRCKLIFRGHINWYDYTKSFSMHHIPRGNVFFLAFLREPVSRAISEYRHITEGLVAQFGPHTYGAAWDYNFTFFPKLALEKKRAMGTVQKWLECRDCQVGSANRMTRFMAGMSTTGTLHREESTRMFVAAKENLERCALIGLMERYEESMLVLRRTFPAGLGRMGQYTNSPHPKTGFQVEITSEEVQRIRELNDMDIRLYQYASTLFQDRWESMLSQLTPDQESMRFRKRGNSFVLAG